MTKQPIAGRKFTGFDLRNNNHKEGQHGITVGYGIGETLRKYALDNKLDPKLQSTVQAVNDAGYRRILDNIDAHDFVAALDKYEFNTAVFASLDNYSAGEYEEDIAYMRDVQKCERASLFVHSQGGWGLSHRIVKNPALADTIDGAVWVASGPGDLAAAPIIAKAGFANWFIVSEDDKYIAGDLCAWSTKMHNAILAAGGKSFLTVLTKENAFTSPHNIFGIVLTYWGNDGTRGLNYFKIAGTVPTMNPYEFLLSNGRGLPVVAPDGVFKPIAKAYQITEAPPIEEEEPTEEGPIIEPGEPATVHRKMKRIVIAPNAKTKSQSLQIFYSNGDEELLEAPEGDRNRGVDVWFADHLTSADVRVTIDYQTAASEPIPFESDVKK